MVEFIWEREMNWVQFSNGKSDAVTSVLIFLISNDVWWKSFLVCDNNTLTLIQFNRSDQTYKYSKTINKLKANLTEYMKEEKWSELTAHDKFCVFWNICRKCVLVFVSTWVQIQLVQHLRLLPFHGQLLCLLERFLLHLFPRPSLLYLHRHREALCCCYYWYFVFRLDSAFRYRWNSLHQREKERKATQISNKEKARESRNKKNDYLNF